jgi:large subunit ribosomal protein L31
VKADIHPKWYPDAVVTCACGNTWTTGSTIPRISTDVCSNCHPFYTGEQRIVDTEGQVDRFMKRLQAREDRIRVRREAVEARTAPTVAVEDLDLGTRNTNALRDAGYTTAGAVVEALNTYGDSVLLDIKGFGQKGLIDLKKALRARGYDVVAAE